MKKLFALLLAVLMAFSMTAVAEEPEEEKDQPMLFAAVSSQSMYKVNIEGLKPGHEFAAFQIFVGTLDASGTLSDIEWGNGVDGSGLLAALKADSKIGSYFADCATAAAVAAVLSNRSIFPESGDNLYAFADVVETHLNRDGAKYSYVDENTYTIGGLPAGYYMIKDVGDIPAGSAATRYILKVTANVTIKPKADAPHADKWIDGEEDTDPATKGNTKVNNVAVGDKIPYIVLSKVPAMDGYENYWFIVNDTMSQGLTYNNDMKVFIDNAELGADAYTVTATTDETSGETTITVVLKNFIQYKPQAGKELKLTYSATLNAHSAIGNNPNPNTVSLTYSNNPNVTYNGDQPTGPNDTTPVGETPDSTVNTYTTAIALHKYFKDADGSSKDLSGAQFQLKGEVKKQVHIMGDRFVEDTSEEATWYKLKTGTYTQTVPTDSNSVAYESTTVKYKRETYNDVETMTDEYLVTGWVNEQGNLVFRGLQAGEYTLTELVAPEGFNKLTTPINFTLTFTRNESAGTGTWTIDNQSFMSEDNDGTFDIEIENKKGSSLPSTGGMGTTVLYIVGGVMVLAAFVLIASKKRAAAE